LVASIEAEYETKLKDLQERHAVELATRTTNGGSGGSGESALEQLNGAQHPTHAPPSDPNQPTDENNADDGDDNDAAAKRSKKQEKARQKREKQRQEELKRERQVAEEIAATAGQTPRDLEMADLTHILQPLGYVIRPVAADGHCLYRAVAAQCSNENSNNNSAAISYQDLRTLCADTLQQHADEFAAFCEYSDAIPDFDTYVAHVRSSAEWGGHLELRVLARALHRVIHVYSTTTTSNHGGSGNPIIIAEEGGETNGDNSIQNKEPIRLSYHTKYYALGEHYNEVVPMDTSQQQEP